MNKFENKVDIVAILKTTGTFSQHDCILFENFLKTRSIQKGNCIISIGQIAQSVYYLLEGEAYQYYLNEENEEKVIDLFTQNTWFTDQNSLVKQVPSITHIKASNDCILLELELGKLHHLISLSKAFLQFGNIIGRASQRTQFYDYQLSPLEKYKFILSFENQILLKFPLKIIASYLKITPETLSRVREKLARSKAIT